MNEYELEATPSSAPFQCLCGAGVPADGPYVRLPVRTVAGDVWLCANHSEVVLESHRLMSLPLYERRVAELRASVDGERDALSADRQRLLDIERRENEAVRERDEAIGRADRADEQLSGAQTAVAELERLVRDLTAELEAVKRGSFTEKMLAKRFDRLAEIVAENAGPAPKPARAKTGTAA